MIESNVKKDLERKIDLYVNGQLTAEEVDDLWVELIQDGYYLDYAKTFANLKQIIEDKRSAQPKKRSGRLQRVVGFASAAAVILFVGILGINNFSSDINNQVSAVTEIPLDTYRNAEGTVEVEAADEKIQQAIQLANRGSVTEAINLLNTELEITQSPKRLAQIGLSLGAIQYNNGDYLNSIGSFELVVSQDELQVLTLEKGYFYLGNAYFQIDRSEKAKDAFQKAYELNGQFRRVAKNYIDVLTLTD